MDVKSEIFWSEIRSRFGEMCGTLPPRISRSTPPPLARPAPGTAAQIALKRIRRKRNQNQISVFIYLF